MQHHRGEIDGFFYYLESGYFCFQAAEKVYAWGKEKSVIFHILICIWLFFVLLEDNFGKSSFDRSTRFLPFPML